MTPTQNNKKGRFEYCCTPTGVGEHGGGTTASIGRARDLELPELSLKWGWQNNEAVGKSWRNGMRWGYRQVVGVVWDIEKKDGRVEQQYGGVQNKGRCKMLVKAGIWWEGETEERGSDKRVGIGK